MLDHWRLKCSIVAMHVYSENACPAAERAYAHAQHPSEYAVRGEIIGVNPEVTGSRDPPRFWDGARGGHRGVVGSP